MTRTNNSKDIMFRHLKGVLDIEETKKKISEVKKGTIPWNKGIKRTEEEKRKISLGLKRAWERRKKFTPGI